MLPPQTATYLAAAGHDARTPVDSGARSLPDDRLAAIAVEDARVIVTENASDFAHVTSCTVLFVLKSWWPVALAPKLATALDRWALAHPEPGPWPHWLEAELR